MHICDYCAISFTYTSRLISNVELMKFQNIWHNTRNIKNFYDMCSKLEYFFELLYFVEMSFQRKFDWLKRDRIRRRLLYWRIFEDKVCNIKCSYQVPKLIENKIMGTELPVVSVAFEMCTLKRCFVWIASLVSNTANKLSTVI